jgi:S-adenosylmethionine:tRNA ribosyltransferase-isomerase
MMFWVSKKIFFILYLPNCFGSGKFKVFGSFSIFRIFAQNYNNIFVSPVNKLKEKTNFSIDDFDYSLPEERIAKYPLKKRDASKLLIYKAGTITENVFSNIASFLPENALLVYNNTKVIEARIHFRKETGALIEVFCLEPAQPTDYALSLSATKECVWKCFVGNQKKWKNGILNKELEINGTQFTFSAELVERKGNVNFVRFRWNNENIHFAEILEKAGELPIPPYLHRATEESDLITYQTVYAKIKGSVAAPTAGLHFTPEVFESLKSRNIETAELTLHVGAGTFQPVKTQQIADHQMHTEVIEIHKSTIEKLLKNIGKIIAVGTTSVRTLESLYYIGLLIEKQQFPDENHPYFFIPQWMPYQTESSLTPEASLQLILNEMNKRNISLLHTQTQLIIQPGYTFRLTNGMITNFHQPKSTLLLLVSAFVDGNWREIYDFALSHDFRFLSYGDSSLLLK